MAYSTEREQSNICMPTLSEYLPTFQNFKSPFLILDNLCVDIRTEQMTDLDVLLLPAVHTVHSLVLLNVLPDHLHVLEDCDVLPLRLYFLLHNAICSYQNYYITFSLSSTFPLHLLKILNPRTWRTFAMYDLQEPHPNNLLHTGVYMDLALSSQHQHVLSGRPC